MRFSSWHCGTILVVASSVLCAQQPVMEVLAGPGRPSTLLAEHLQQHREAFVVVGIGLWVQALVGDALGGSWAHLEHQRGTLQAAFRATDAVYAAIGEAPISADFVQEIGDCLALLEHQRGGTEPPMELLDRVWQRLLHGFDRSHSNCPEPHVDGIVGPLRRTGCHLVRIPIRWRGEHTSAVAFHWWVEHREPDGSWRRAAR